MCKFIRLLLPLLSLIFLSYGADSQEMSKSVKKTYKKAMGFFNEEEFPKALGLFLQIDSIYPGNFEVSYYIGACYLNTTYEKVKGIPYLEFAVKNGNNLIPKAVFYDLAGLYHLDYQFVKAKEHYEKFLTLTEKDDPQQENARRMIVTCVNALKILEDTLRIEIENVGSPVNTENNEYTPFISADEQALFFTRGFSKEFGNTDIEFQKKVFFSTRKNEYWQTPVELLLPQLPENSTISLAGISPDGESLFFSVSSAGDADLYTCRLLNGQAVDFEKLSEPVNSPFTESGASITPDGNFLYYSSNRPGGFGGMDLYISEKGEDGKWGTPLNAGNLINTVMDEDAPFIHPAGNILYFSSKGHECIGGYDIFQSFLVPSENSWTEPRNIGYPINTTGDDLSYVISADGNSAYFSSSQNNPLGKADLFRIILHKTIPLTMVKGTIMGGEPPMPIKARIRVIDNETKQRIKYVYNPNPKTGKYLMIFPPNKNYDMYIEAEGYYPHLINIHVPDQTYFYELFQEINLNKVRVSEKDSAVGQEITVLNTFYDIYGNQRIQPVDSAIAEKYDNLLNIVEDIINTTDSIGLESLDSLSLKALNNSPGKEAAGNKDYNELLDMIENAIEETDSIQLAILDNKAIYNDVTNEVYFYDATKGSPDLEMVIVGNDTLYTLPKIDTRDAKRINPEVQDTSPQVTDKTQRDFRIVPESQRNYFYIAKIYYSSGQSLLPTDYESDLKDILNLLLLNTDIGIEIDGYTDTQGDPEKNLELSKSRAFSVMEYFANKQITKERIIYQGFGESKSRAENGPNEMRLNRRVEIKLFNVKE